MRILFVANEAGFLGGGEHSLLDLARGLAGRGHETAVVVPGDGDLAAAARAAGLDVDLVEIPRLKGLGLLSLPAAGARLRAILGRRRTEVVSAGGARAVLASAAAARLAGARLVWHVRVAAPDPLDPFLAILAHRIVANSRATAARFAGRARARVRVVPVGIDVGRVARGPAARIAARAALGLPPDAEVVGCVGRFTEEKGQDVLARAVVPLLAARPALHVVFVGDDATPFGARVRTILRPGDRVRYTGWRPDLLDLYAAFDVLVVPSRIEGFGRVVVEGFAAEVAVVATEAGGLAETLGPAGVRVPLDSADDIGRAIRDLLDDDAGRAAIARAGRWRAEAEFALERSIEATEAAYQEALGRSATTTRFAAPA